MLDLPGGVQSVETWHGKVEKGQVWTKVASKLDGLASVGGFPDHVEFLRIEQGFDVLSKRCDGRPRGGCAACSGEFREPVLIERTHVSRLFNRLTELRALRENGRSTLDHRRPRY